jgi:hypothetical protein
VGLQLLKRTATSDAISVALAFLAEKIFMLRLFDFHPCLDPTTIAWIADGSECIPPFAYIRRLSGMAFTFAITGSIHEIVRVLVFAVAEDAVGLGVRATIRWSGSFRKIKN